MWLKGRLKQERHIFSTFKFRKDNWAVFISGQGSNLRSLLHAKEQINIKLVVSTSNKSNGLLFAKRAGCKTLVLEKNINWQELSIQLTQLGINAIFLLGFMKIIPAEFVGQWKGKMLNLHPSLLPKYPGLKSIERAYENQDSIGCTVHIVTEEMDAGPIVKQRIAVDKSRIKRLTLEEAEFLTHVAEQRLLLESLKKWTIEPTY